MTTKVQPMIGAPSACLAWESIQWKTVNQQVRRLQMRIAKATREEKHGKAKSLQWILTHSLYAKLLAVKRVTENTGSKTPGIDGITWKTPEQKMLAVKELQRRSYQTQPLRRIYIPKKNGGRRPLSIPTMKCRAMQALHLLALEPIAETKADKNSYGFRPKRSCADAIEQCFKALCRKTAAQYILEGDIKSCFDRISHAWLNVNVPMDKKILNKWLTAGYVEKQIVHETETGTPQGGIISPTLLTITLSGLEEAIRKIAPDKRKDKVHICIYADDFIVTGATKEVLEQKIKPTVEAFLRERGLELSQEKTKITHIEEGFDFLGFTIRKYNNKLITKPSKKSIKTFLEGIRETIKLNKSARTEVLIWQLNSKIIGWSNYYRHAVSKKVYEYIDHNIYQALYRWIKHRHPNKSWFWRRKKYFRTQGNRHWIFSAKIHDKDNKAKWVDLKNAQAIKIKRHTKIRAEATPYDPNYREYFEKRERFKSSTLRSGLREAST
jgi:RNA-directed DNA polymerase